MILNELKKTKINVVGNAESLFNMQYGKYIDLYPTIRFNTIQNLDSISQGSRWDYLASSNIKTINYYNMNKPRFHTFLFTMYEEWHIKNLDAVNFQSNIYTLPYIYTSELKNILGNNFPSTGITILYYLDKIKHFGVNIFGFDWKNTKTYYNKKDKKNDPHDYDTEKELCLNFIKKNNWGYYEN